jgi:bifunctional UDP-N-acetylglucosamine pyrophosphorylase/glucosamine-1-phosphate N-acetyltransferase
METDAKTASVILAAGRGTRMKDLKGNKTLLPLIPGRSSYDGDRPMLLQILKSLPSGPKAVVVHHRKEEVMEATRGLGLTYCQQVELNGTGGALLAARPFLESQTIEQIIVTMGDVPLVKGDTYKALVRNLRDTRLTVLGFRPQDKRQYGVLEIDEGLVKRIIEYKYWKTFPKDRQAVLEVCNSGIYAARRHDFLRYLSVLASRPHKIQKEINGHWVELKEFFVTDLVGYMSQDGLPVGYILAEDETEVMGVDDPSALRRAQRIFRGLDDSVT